METKIDVERGFRFIFEDPNWLKKLGIAGLLYLTIIGAIPVFGWALEVQRRTMHDHEEPLPDWSAFGEYIVNAFKVWLVYVIWALPIILLILVGIIPLAIIEAAFLEYVVIAVLIFLAVILPISLAYSLFLYGLYPILSGQYLENDSIREAINVRRAIRLFRVNWIEMIVASILGYAASYIASFVGLLLCGIGVFLLAPAGMAIMFYYYGQAYRNAVKKLEHQQSLPAG
jgi:hypothetical protein